jgi:2-succinyl-6-hydroxy-2,4-cyclohexadiene-1-carboxylate synthase
MLVVGRQDVGMRETLVLLHGFTQTGRSWLPVLAALGPARYRAIAPDLRGHGDAGRRRPIGFDELVADVLDAVEGDFTLVGYSQGGRVALHVALVAPERVRALVLVSTTAGIEDPAERAERVVADEALAARIEGQGIEAAARAWAAQALFGGQTPEVRELSHEDRLRNDPVNLAAALRGIGTGVMAPLWDRLGELTMPAAVVVGERDEKFVQLGRRLADELPDASFSLVPAAGHALPIEAPDAIAAAIGSLQPSQPAPRPDGIA